MLLKHVDDKEDVPRHYRAAMPPPKRSRQNAHMKLTFWIAWIATSLFLWAIVVNVVHFPKPGTKWDFGIQPKTANGRELAKILGFGGTR